MPKGERSAEFLERAEARAKGEQHDAIIPGDEDEEALARTDERVGDEPEPGAGEQRSEEAEADDTLPAIPAGIKNVHKKRAEIAATVNAKREEDDERVAEEREAARGEAELAPGEEPEDRDDQPIKKRILRVNREDFEVTEDEFENFARIGKAYGDDREAIKDIKRRLANELAVAEHLRQVREAGDDDSAIQQDQRDASQSRERTQKPPSRGSESPSKDALKTLLDEIRFGDDDAGIEALESLFRPAPTVEEVAAAVRQQDEVVEARARVAKDFADKHPAVVKDPYLVDLTTRRAQELCIAEMRELEVDESFIREAAADYRVAFTYHKDLLDQGYKLTKPNDLSDQAAKWVEKRFRVVEERPTPGRQADPSPRRDDQSAPARSAERDRATREEDKANMRQPRRAAMIARTPGNPAPKSTGDVIGQMRAHRKLGGSAAPSG